MSDIYFTPPSFADAIAEAAVTQTAWGTSIKELLGNVRQLVGIRNGVEFYRCSLSGEMRIVGGKITYFGKTINVTKNLAVDLSTGTSELRIEGNGNVVHASLGVKGGPVKDYMLDFNPDGVSPLAFSPSASLSPYGLLPTGVGPAAPARTEFMAHTVKLWDWSNPVLPVLVDTIHLDTLKPYWTLQDAEMAQVYGDWLRYHNNTPIVWGNYRLNARMTISDKSHGVSNTAPLQTVRVRWEYNWPGFPESTNYDKKNMLLCPPPHKLTYHDAHDTLLFTDEWPGGKAINDISFPQTGPSSGGNVAKAWSPTTAFYPRFDISQVNIWKSEPSAINPLARKLFTGLRNYRPTSMAKSRLTCNPVVPAITGGYAQNGANGLAHMNYLPRLPMPYTQMALSDPYLDVVMNNSGASSQYYGWAEGYARIAGGYGGADTYTSTGGGRFDRTGFDSAAIMAIEYPGQNRLQGNVPWSEIAHEWLLNSYNYGFHWDINKEEVKNGGWAFRGKYYGDPALKTTKEILFNYNQRDGTFDQHFDASNQMVMNGKGIDPLHDYRQVGKLACLYLSPDLIEESYYDTVKSFIIHGMGDQSGQYMVRTQAWNWYSYVIAWKCATSNPEGFSQQEIESRFITLADWTYNTVDKPTFVDNVQSPMCIGIRNLGTPLVPNDAKTGYGTPGGRLFFYMADVLIWFKQTGFWSRMYSKGGNTATVMRNMLRNMDVYCYDQILDTNGDANGGYSVVGDGNNLNTIPASWAAYWADQVALNGPNMANDFLHMYNEYAPEGQKWGWYTPNTDHSSHTFESYPYMREAFYPEFPNPRIAPAIAKFQQYETFVTNRVINAPTPQEKMREDYSYRIPGNGPKLPPAPGLLGPA